MIWHCRPKDVRCVAGHRLVARNTAIRMGHIAVSCTRCAPPTYAFGVVVVAPNPLVTLYAITEAQMHAFHQLPDDLTTLELLKFFGYHHRRSA